MKNQLLFRFRLVMLQSSGSCNIVEDTAGLLAGLSIPCGKATMHIPQDDQLLPLVPQ